MSGGKNRIVNLEAGEEYVLNENYGKKERISFLFVVGNDRIRALWSARSLIARLFLFTKENIV